MTQNIPWLWGIYAQLLYIDLNISFPRPNPYMIEVNSCCDGYITLNFEIQINTCVLRPLRWYQYLNMIMP